MINSEVIIVGAGPAGSTCGWKLKEKGVECLILDKQKFPRAKLCAGWITPQVIKDLEMDVARYPHSLVKFKNFHVHIFNRLFKIKVHQYAIRRYEFDDWLLKRSRVAVHKHEVKNIKRDGDYYVIDDQYRSKYLIGAGGTHCPVYRSFFKPVNPRAKDLMVVTLEQEFRYDYQDDNCHLWFFQNKLPGYSWYVPKNNGYLNIGIGALSTKLKDNHDTIRHQWQQFTKQLEKQSLVKNYEFNPKGSAYYTRGNVENAQIDQAFLVGDAAGLATKDMGEGIGPAVKSGLLAAETIMTGKPYAASSVKKYSIHGYRFFIRLINFIWVF